MYRYIYKITCTAGRFKGKYYYGQHTTDNLNDGYKGSGRLLLKYYKKYPRDFVKEIISFHDTYDELNAAEETIIAPVLGDPMCLNLTDGGGRLPDSVIARASESYTGYKHTPEACALMSQKQRERVDYYKSKGLKIPHKKGYHMSEEAKNNVCIAIKKRYENHVYAPKKPTPRKYTDEEYHEVMSKMATERQLGAKWMNDGVNEMFVYADRQQEYINNGYKFGRIFTTKGIKYSEESKAKISAKAKGRYSGAKWMHKGNERSFVMKDKIEEYLNNGYVYGRI